MIGADSLATLMIDFERRLIADLDGDLAQTADLRVQGAGLLLRVLDNELGAVRKVNDPMIAGLAAAFGVKGRAIEDERALLALLHLMALFAMHDDRGQRAFALFGAIAEEF